MKIDNRKLNLALARQCMAVSDLREGSSPQTLRKVLAGNDIKPKTVGRIARALNVDPAELIEEGDSNHV